MRKSGVIAWGGALVLSLGSAGLSRADFQYLGAWQVASESGTVTPNISGDAIDPHIAVSLAADPTNGGFASGGGSITLTRQFEITNEPSGRDLSLNPFVNLNAIDVGAHSQAEYRVTLAVSNGYFNQSSLIVQTPGSNFQDFTPGFDDHVDQGINTITVTLDAGASIGVPNSFTGGTPGTNTTIDVDVSVNPQISPNAVPEPSSFAMLGLGALAALGVGRRRAG